MRIIPSLALLLRSEEIIDRYFAAQAMTSLVCNGSRGMNLAIANSGAVAGLITLIGYVESDMPNLVALAEEFSLVKNPDQVVLEHLFEIEDVRVGSTARKTIPLLVDLLRPMPDRPGAPPTAVRLLTQIADGSDTNKLLMAEAGALDALTKYLSLSPQDLTEATISELLRILFSNPDLLRYEASVSSLNQLIAVLRLGSRSARLSAARALHVLFDAENIRDSELAKQAVQPLVDMLEAASESEQHTALIGLIKLTSGNSSKAVLMTDVEGNPLESLYKILSSSNSLELKTNAAQLCFLWNLVFCAFERLLDEEQQVEFAAAYDIVELLVGLVSGSNSRLIEASICALIKLGKDRTPRKLDMVKAGIIDNCLELLPTASSALSSSIAELLRILTNSSAISKSSESPSQPIQQLGTELMSHILAQQHFKQDITTKNAVIPLVQLAGIGILNLQQTAIKSLENISLSWPKAVADAGGIFELAKVIIQDDPQPPHALWESAALVLSNVLRSNADYYFKVPLVVLVKMLHSTHESTVTVALNALIVQESSDASSAELMTEAGAIDALLDLLRSHTCEEASGRLLEALFNNVRVREMKVSKYAIAPLAQYLLDPQTRSQSGKLLAALALGDLSQREGLARASDSVSACRALISLLEDQPTEEMQMVAICALQNFVMHSRTNRRAVAEAGGILVIQELLVSPNPEAVGQAALLIKFLFSNHTLQEYVSNELIRSLTEKWGISQSSSDSWHGDLGVVVFDRGYVWRDVGVPKNVGCLLDAWMGHRGKKVIKAWYLVALALMWIIVGGQAEDG
ncbi:similar to CELLULOSE SYNTHASE INTERACTIVE 3 [Actinidia rufa]|uniref:Similar to CELLULOSE SYNTHASE INTERACTIVE 3 n=1 Tax=Actinidia rufa TaxID=165716 RepID=A0A7J0DQ85_9ERIC|nr:similar to CELLULOSE SYNTHASE INTERACTIVE 3 [Actinidia rufa]